jgi:hypothetical protein
MKISDILLGLVAVIFCIFLAWYSLVADGDIDQGQYIPDEKEIVLKDYNGQAVKIIIVDGRIVYIDVE